MNNKIKTQNPILSTIVSWLVIILLISQVGLSAMILRKIDPSLFTITNSNLLQGTNNDQNANLANAPSPIYLGKIPISESDMIRGDLNKAQVTIIEFGDYQCPYCANAHINIKDLLKKYPDKIAFVFFDFPLSTHADAFMAAEAAHCAGDQGKYWDMHDKIFADQANLGVENLRSRADKLGLDIQKYDECMESQKYKSQIEQEINLGKQFKVSGTPTIIVNGYKIGVPNLSIIPLLIKNE